MENGRVIEIRNCIKDIVYFAENYYTSANLTGIQKLPLHKAQKRVLRGMTNNQNIVTLGARQVGLTTLNGIYALWEAMFFSDVNIIIMSHKLICAETIMDRMKMAYEKMPDWLKPEVNTWNKEYVKFKNGSSIRICSSNGRSLLGMTASTLIIDNASFVNTNDMNDIWNSMIPVLSASPHGKIILTSSARRATDKFAEICNIAQRSNNDWHFDTIKWDDVQGRNNKWKKNMIKCLGGIETFKTEFECEFI